ncbi:MAG: tetraacyldisaccharide 4'-kinase [Hyphomonadaceae bacterium]
MRPPEFWNAEARGRDAAPMVRALLTPVSWLYAAAVEHKFRTAISRQAPAPVVCIGNLTVGGAGKTPIARAVRARLGPHAHMLSRGYGGRTPGPLRVRPEMDAREVGDEPLLHAQDGPAWIARDRFAGALAAAQAGARVIVMDDGFQNPALAKDLSVIVVDPGFGVGNGQVFPAGPLRERLSRGLARADAVVLLHNAQAVAAPAWLKDFARPILDAHITPAGTLPNGKLIAFAGLARPEKFFETLERLGGDLAEALPFGDHHAYGADDLRLLEQLAAERGATLITTEKDAVRLAPDWRARVAVLPVVARFSDEAALDALLAPIVSRMTGAHG